MTDIQNISRGLLGHARMDLDFFDATEWEKCLADLQEKQWSVSDRLISSSLTTELYVESNRLYENGLMRPAEFGGKELQQNSGVRGDQILWINGNEAEAAVQKWWNCLEFMRNSMNREFFLGLNHFECHWARYDSGKGYARHLDQPKGKSERQITFVFYLNPAWQYEDGGELLIYKPNEADKLELKVEPIFGRLLLFRSEIWPHEVSPSFKARRSLTGWFRKQSLGAF